MPTSPKIPSATLSRRGLLHGAAIAAGGGALLVGGLSAGGARAATKLSQKMANYQTKPMGKAQCDGCTQWAPPAACKTVDGVISPSGWCSLYAPKS